MSKQPVSNQLGSGGPATDLTPCAVGNWLQGGAVVLLSPAATLHQKVALAWGMATEAETLVESARYARSTEHAKALQDILWERLTVLSRLLGELGRETAVFEQQGAEA